MHKRHLDLGAFVLVLLIGGAAWAQEPGRGTVGPNAAVTQRQGASPGAALVSKLHISDLGDPSQRSVARFPAGIRGVRCSFAIPAVPRGTAISIRWLRAGEELMTSDFDETAGNSELSSHLESEAGLEAGDYQALVLVDGVPDGRASFSVEAGDREAPAERAVRRASLTGVTVTGSTCDEAPAPQPGDRPRFTADVEEIFLCLQYEGMGSGRQLDVRWYHDASRAPMTVTTLEPSHRGELSASYLPAGPMEPGAYHVVLALDGRRIERVDFTVASPL